MSQEPEFALSSPLNENETSLTERVAQLEKKLEETLLLLSDVYRYGKLRDSLAAGQWKEADLETSKIMLEISGKKNKDDITPEDLNTFPQNDLRVIDQLWRKYSQDRFGFSVQLQIYQSVGGDLDAIRRQDLDILRKFAAQVGWLENGSAKFDRYNQWNFSLSAPVGCFPAIWWVSPYGIKMANFFLACLLDYGFSVNHRQ